jgi:hypothetical protein
VPGAVLLPDQGEALFHGLPRLTDRFTARVGDRLAAAGREPGPRATIEALLPASLPTDEESRILCLLHSSYASLSVTDEASPPSRSSTTLTPPRMPSPN